MIAPFRFCEEIIPSCKVAHPHSGSFFTIPAGTGIYKCSLLRIGVPGVKRREPTTNSTRIIMALTPKIEPGPHWWKARALNIGPSLAPPRNEIKRLTRLQSSLLRKERSARRDGKEERGTEISVYSVANYRPHLSHFWANVIFAILI